ncbi:MAG: LegC family aminotransferase [Saprospiraceae bacterium]
MIPLSIPNICGNEWTYVKDCLESGWISSVGSYVTKFEEGMASFTGAKYAVAAMNGSAAIHLSLQLAGVKMGDFVIVPDITFVASCNTITYVGAEPLLIDVDRYSWQMDLDILESFLEENTFLVEGNTEDGKMEVYAHLKDSGRRIGAILPVHVLGNMCDMDRLLLLCSKYHIPIVEDSTEALGSTFKGKHAGTFGMFGTSSFNGNKIISTGGGGMILTNDEFSAKKAKHLTTQAKTDPFEYDHDEIGYNYRLVNILAAVGVAQLEQLPGFLERKKTIDSYYRSHLENETNRFQKVTNHVSPNNWLHTIWVDQQRPMIEHLLKNEIQCRPFWVPMHQLKMFKDCPYITQNNVSNEVYQHCISIPSSTNLTDAQVEEVVYVMKAFY